MTIEIQWSLIPDMSASVTLRELVAADLIQAAEALAKQIAKRSPHAISAAKPLFRSTRQSSSNRM